MTVINVWVGAAQPDTVTVVAKTDGTFGQVHVSLLADLSDPVLSDVVTASARGIVKATISGLAPGTRYHVGVEDDDGLDAVYRGQFRTLPQIGSQVSFVVGAASCAGTSAEYPGEGDVLAPNRLSNSPLFATIRNRAVAEDWLAWVSMGDLHYYDLGSGNHGITGGGSADNYYRSIDDVLLQPNQHLLYRSVNTAWGYDDHDWGPDNSNGTIAGRQNVLDMYQDRIPHYPRGSAADPTAPSHTSWQIGRVLFVQWDVRADRSPNADTDGPAKTMLGQRQKDWFEALLASSTAQALVVFSGSQWEYQGASIADTWTNFATERDELVQIMGAPGGDPSRSWLHRMVLVQGDAHSAGLRSGQSQPWGGFPVYQYASLDTSISGAQSWKDVLASSARGQYGTIAVQDAGSLITITGTVYRGADALGSHTLEIHPQDAPGPDPDPPPIGPPPVAVGAIKRDVTWLGVNDQTGRIVAELPDMTGEVGRVLTAYESSKLTYPLVQTGPGGIPIETLVQSTQPQATSIVAVVNNLPVWAGRVLQRVRGSGRDMTLACATSEQYLKNRLVNAHTYVGMDRAQIGFNLLTDAGSTDFGAGMALEFDVALTGDLIDREYLPSDQITVYDALRALATGGLEWTIDLDFSDVSQTVVRRIMRLAPRIGRVGVDVPLFETAGDCDARYELDENHTSDRFANAITCWGDGEEDDTPVSETVYDAAALAGGYPIVHKAIHVRDTTDPVELTQIAWAELHRLRFGAELWKLDALFDAFPRLGFDAGLGDDINWDVVGPGHPHGVQGEGRMIRWLLDTQAGRWSPYLLDPHDEEVLHGSVV